MWQIIGVFIGDGYGLIGGKIMNREDYIEKYGITFDKNDEAFEKDVEDVYVEVPEEERKDECV